MTSHQQIEINVNKRGIGKGLSRALRKSKRIPAIVYGPNIDNTTIDLPLVEAEKYSKHQYENTVFTFKSEDSKLNGQSVLIKDITRHPATHFPVHIDFYAPDMKQAVRVHVELKYEGKPAGAADGGIFGAVRRDVEVECLPNEIPDHIVVDVSSLELNGSLHVSDIQIPAGVKLITAGNETIATCAVVEEEKEEAPTTVAEGAAAEAGAADKKTES